MPAVVRRDLDLARPANLAAGALILALGIAIGHWCPVDGSDSAPVGHRDSAVSVVPAVVSKTEPRTVPAPTAVAVDADQNGSHTGKSSSSDTLFQKVNDLLERVKRGE